MNNEFELTEENYYSSEANQIYMSFHQYLSFAGGMALRGCEERAMAEMRGEWKEEPSVALMVGSYVDAFFEHSLDKFKAEHPDIFTQKGELKAPYRQADKMIEKCVGDEYFMKSVAGEKQVIMTGYWAGTLWKIKMDSYIPGVAITDIKTSADIHKAWKIADYGYASFIEAFNYDKQLALYQKIVEINTGKKLPCYISVVTKEDYPEIAVISIDQMAMDHALNEIEMNMPSILAVKNGEMPPIGCGKCDYCKSIMKLDHAISSQDLIEV